MPARTLRRFYVVVLTAVAVWPIAQWYLVEKYDANPWKLCGFAMYCTPHEFGMDVIDTTRGRRVMSLKEIEATNDQYGLFFTKRRHLGKLYSPQPVADAIFAASLKSIRLPSKFVSCD